MLFLSCCLKYITLYNNKIPMWKSCGAEASHVEAIVNTAVENTHFGYNGAKPTHFNQILRKRYCVVILPAMIVL